MTHKWMCDVIGNQPAITGQIEQVIKDGISADTLELFIGDRGNLSTNIKEFIKDSGFVWTDCGGGANDWHIGVPFDDIFDACYYANLLTKKFSKAIGSGFLKVKIMSWSASAWADKQEAK